MAFGVYLVSMRCKQLVIPCTLMVVLLGCKRHEEVQVYHAPKEQIQAAPVANASAKPSTPGSADAPAANKPPWLVPEGWTEKPSTGGMRIASYAVTAPDGRNIDISVIPLGAQSGSMLDNVNRWRGQLQLGPLTEDQLNSTRQRVKIGEYDGDYYEMVSEKPTLEDKYKARTLAAVLPLPGTTVFFKATGEDALVRENATKFQGWLKSVQTGPNTGGGSPANASGAGSAPAANPPSEMKGPVAAPPSTALPSWEVPNGWKSVPASTMRLASFSISGANGAMGDLSVVALGPSSGGTLANVNRWRNQFGLSPLDEAGLGKTLMSVDLIGGQKAEVVELVGEGGSAGKRMLAAIVSRPDRTWFYKLSGEDTLVAGEKANFLKFLKSVKYP